MFDGFSDAHIKAGSVRLRVRQGGPMDGEGVLLLHGYPQTGACWHHVAPELAQAGYRVIVADLRGYGGSDRPETDAHHMPYSKRVMAADQAQLMQHLGFDRYHVIGHDRGARVAHRLARDFPQHVSSISVLDIVPTDHMYRHADMKFAQAYYHWFFLIQPHPLPETLIGQEPSYYLTSKLKAWSRSNFSVYDKAALNEYIACFDERAIHATCEDYRAAATIDLQHDEADIAVKLTMPLLALWGAQGFVGSHYDVLEVWRSYAHDVQGKGLPCGHFLPEECPRQTVQALLAFLNGRNLA